MLGPDATDSMRICYKAVYGPVSCFLYLVGVGTLHGILLATPVITGKLDHWVRA